MIHSVTDTGLDARRGNSVAALVVACPDVEAVWSIDPFQLAALLAPLGESDILELPTALAEVVVAATQRVINAVTTRQAVAVTAFVESVALDLAESEERSRVDDEARGLRHIPNDLDPIQAAASMLAPLMRVAPRTMTTREHHARQLVNELPRTLAAAWHGDLEPYRVETIVRASLPVQGHLLVEFDARVHHDPTLTTAANAAVRTRALRAAVRTDPEGVERHHRRARRTRNVSVAPGDSPGMSHWTADLPADTSQQMWAAIETLATEFLAADAAAGTPKARTVSNARADALTALLLANASVTTHVELVLPVRHNQDHAPAVDLRLTFRPASGGPGQDDDLITTMIQGLHTPDTADRSPLEWDLALQLQRPYEILTNPNLRTATDGTAWFVPSPVIDNRVGVLLPTMLSTLLTDPDLRVSISAGGSPTGSRTYRPGAALARTIRARDRHCRFPGCTVPAAQCDLDHAIAYPTGDTTPDNLHALCRFHHLFKHHAGWTVRLDPDGTCIWTAPTGRTHVTSPPNLHDQAA